MRLADFIDQHLERIVGKWTSGLPSPSLRIIDDGELHGILTTIACDLRTSGQPRGQADAAAPGSGEPRAAAGTSRGNGSADVRQLIGEYRLLRAVVLGLWSTEHRSGSHTLDDTTRFNEAIDHAVAESLDRHIAATERWRDLFLASVAHDLRGPLGTAHTTAHVLSRASKEPAVVKSADVLLRSTMRMAQLLDALSDYNRVALGQGLPVSPAHCDLVAECAAELDLLRAHPHAPFTWTTSAPAVHGVYDASRVRQALANLVTNAIKYGRSGAPVVVTFEPLLNGARLAVENEGHPVSAEQRAKIFEPLYRGPACKGKDGGMGLGLFIAREVARAHGGDVECQPGADGMTFVVTLQSAALPGSADPHAAG